MVAGLALAVAWSSAEGEEVVIEPFTFSCDSAVDRRTKVVLGGRYRLPRERERCLAAVGGKAGFCRQMTDSGKARILARRECGAGFHKQVGRCVAYFEAEREKCGGTLRVVNVAALGDAKRRAIQAALVSNGFSLGRIDGKFGPKTRKSVREWQSKAGHAVTGELTSGQIRELLEGREPRSVSTPSSATAQTFGDLTTKSIRWANGAVYHGQTLYGKPHGRGVLTWANGDRYEGDFRDGKPHGRGVSTFASGSRYEGDYFAGKRHGRGVTTYPSGNRYEGDNRAGKRHGRGVLTWANGDRYEGSWTNNKPYDFASDAELTRAKECVKSMGNATYRNRCSQAVAFQYCFKENDGNLPTCGKPSVKELHGKPEHYYTHLEHLTAGETFEVPFGNRYRFRWIACPSRGDGTYYHGVSGGQRKYSCRFVNFSTTRAKAKYSAKLAQRAEAERKRLALQRRQEEWEREQERMAAERRQEEWEREQERMAAERRQEEWEREEEEWEREQERMAAERRRRTAETWNSIGRTLGTILMEDGQSSGSTGSRSGSGRRCPPGMKAATCEPGYPCRPEHTVKTAC